MRLTGPVLFFPVAFSLCTFSISTYRYFSIPGFSIEDVAEVKAIVLKIEDDEFEAASYQPTDTLYYSGLWTDKRPESGQEVTLYKIKDENKYLFQSKSHFDQLIRSKNKAKWISLSSLFLLSIAIYFLFTSSKRKQNG